MDINVRAIEGMTVVELSGEMTWSSVPEAEPRILDQVRPEGKLCLDMSRVTYLASAGLQLLLKVYRGVSNARGRVVLVGLCDEIRNTLEVTGFLDFFTQCDSLTAGIAELNS